MVKGGESAPKHKMTPAKPKSILGLLESGEQRGMALLYDQYSEVVYSVALCVLRDPAAAEMVLQDVLMQVWRAPKGFGKSDASLAIKLVLAARDRAIELLRREYRDVSDEHGAFSSIISLSDAGEHAKFGENARTALRQLPREQSSVLRMAFFDGMNPSEIAEIIVQPAAKVRQYLRQALLEIRKAALP